MSPIWHVLTWWWWSLDWHLGVRFLRREREMFKGRIGVKSKTVVDFFKSKTSYRQKKSLQDNSHYIAVAHNPIADWKIFSVGCRELFYFIELLKTILDQKNICLQHLKVPFQILDGRNFHSARCFNECFGSVENQFKVLLLQLLYNENNVATHDWCLTYDTMICSFRDPDDGEWTQFKRSWQPNVTFSPLNHKWVIMIFMFSRPFKLHWTVTSHLQA